MILFRPKGRLALTLSLLAMLAACDKHDAAGAARASISKGDYESAAVQLRAAVQSDPGSAELRVMLADTLERKHDLAGAQENLAKAVESEGNANDSKNGSSDFAPLAVEVRSRLTSCFRFGEVASAAAPVGPIVFRERFSSRTVESTLDAASSTVPFTPRLAAASVSRSSFHGIATRRSTPGRPSSSPSSSSVRSFGS